MSEGQRGSLNAVLSPNADVKLYNPNRDIAHNFPSIIKIVAARLEHGVWEAVEKIIEHYDVSDEELSLALDSYIRFIASVTENPDETMEQAAKRSGFLDTSEVAQVCLLAYLGTVVGGYFWQGAREVTMGGRGPASSLQELIGAGETMLQTVSKVPGRRVNHKALGWVASGLMNCLSRTECAMDIQAHSDKVTFFDGIERKYYEIVIVETERPT